MAKRKEAESIHESTTENTAAPVPERSAGDEPSEQAPKKFATDPFGIASDYLSGDHLSECRRYRRSQHSFDEKPSHPVIDLIKEHGFCWNAQDKLWSRPIEAAATLQDRIDAEKLFQEVSKLLSEEKSLGASQSKAPF